MPRGFLSQATLEHRADPAYIEAERIKAEALAAERQLALALNSYQRMKAEAIKGLVAYRQTKDLRHLSSAREAVDLAEHARKVAAQYQHPLPALPAIPSPARRAS